MNRSPVIWRDVNRSPRRQRLVRHLHRCGPRMVLQALIHTEAGTPLDTVLEVFCSLEPEDYRAAGVDVLPIDRLKVVNGGRK
jgi:hypothetical protein